MSIGSRPIQVLPPELVARIAAGEVITRPRAALKELVDNAIDAGATTIDIEVASGGFDLIAVHDNGDGIRAADAALVFTRHATSKLAGEGALGSVTTLGFRGEALASMAAVADVLIRTRHRDETVGTSISCAWGSESSTAPLARQPGTSIEVRHLFERYPVRRGSADPAAEGRALRRLVIQLALSRPEIAFTLRADNRLVVQSSGGSARAVFAAIHGQESLPYLLDVGPLQVHGARVSGIVSGPGTHRGNRDGIVLTVNGRLCGVVELQRAIERAFVEVLPRHRYPLAVLSVTLPPERIDVNVHPSKERVVIHDGKAIATTMEAELRSLLGRTAHLVAEKRSLALQVAQLPGLGVGEDATPYTGGGWGGRVVEAGSLPRLRVVGHVEDTLIVCESDLGTLLVDQHRAHERVIYERLLAHESIALDEPVVVVVPPVTLSMLDARAEDLRSSGWDWEEFGAGQLLVTACPACFEPPDLLPIAEQFMAETAHSIIAASACHAAIRKRRAITPEAAVELLEALTRTPTPTTCPHGQPIVINLDRTFLERQFGWR